MTADPSDAERPPNGLIDAPRRKQVMSMRLAGMSFQEIGDHFGISKQAIWQMIHLSLQSEPNRQAEELRAIENLRLDTAQARIWSKVLEGDLKATETFLKISARRARMNGLDLAADLSVSVTVQKDLDKALEQLEQVIKGEVIPDEQD